MMGSSVPADRPQNVLSSAPIAGLPDPTVPISESSPYVRLVPRAAGVDFYQHQRRRRPLRRTVGFGPLGWNREGRHLDALDRNGDATIQRRAGQSPPLELSGFAGKPAGHHALHRLGQDAVYFGMAFEQRATERNRLFARDVCRQHRELVGW